MHIETFVEAAVASGRARLLATGTTVSENTNVGSGSGLSTPATSLIDMVKACAIKNMIPTRYTGTCFVRMHGHTDAVALMAGAQDHRIDGRQIKVSACWDADIEDVVQLCCDVVDFSIAMDLVVPACSVGKLI